MFTVLTLGGRSASEAGSLPLRFVDTEFSWVGTEALSMSGSFLVRLAADDWRREKRFWVGILTRTKVLQPRVLTKRGLPTRGSYNQGSYSQGFLQAGVLISMGSYNQGFLLTGVLTTRGLKPGVLTARGSYSQGFLQPWVLKLAVLTTTGVTPTSS